MRPSILEVNIFPDIYNANIVRFELLKITDINPIIQNSSLSYVLRRKDFFFLSSPGVVPKFDLQKSLK